jgi:tetratricopeptide (TPR) repeat protein
MNRFFLFTILVFAFVTNFGCGKSSTSANDAQNTEQVPEYSDANSALAEGNRLLDANQTEQAIEAFKQASSMNPDLGEPYFKLGIAYSLLEAEERGKLSADPLLPGEQTNKAGQPKPESKKAFEKAVEVYKKWVANNPNDDAAYFNLGRAYNKLNQDEDAERSLRQAVKLKADDAEYQTELGAILIKLAKYREAIDPLKKALDLDPDDSQAADLLDDAEAGRARIDYVPPKKDDGNKSSNTNANADANANTSQPPISTGEKTPEIKEKKETKESKDSKNPPPSNKPSKPQS